MRLFEYGHGATKQGYWTYDHMACQMEDCIDVLTVAFKNKFDYCLLLDHSQGHDRKKPDGLNADKMAKAHSAAQVRMRDTDKLTADNIGPYQYGDPCQLKVGDVQRLWWDESFVGPNDGPIFLTPEQRIAQRNDRDLNESGSKNKTCKELIEELQAKGLQPRGLLKDLQGMAQQNDIAIKKSVRKIKEGWINKSKGVLQVLYERGFINRSKLSDYKMEPFKDDNGNILDDTYSLKVIMSKQTDFINEETMLEYNLREIGQQRGFQNSLLRSPKCHPEVAGEGVEYNIAHAKIYIRSISWQKRTNIREFQKYVLLAFSRRGGANITEHRSIAFSRRARDYIIAYYLLHCCQNREKDAPLSDLLPLTMMKEEEFEETDQVRYCALPMEMIKNMRKTYKCHRSMDFLDIKFTKKAGNY